MKVMRILGFIFLLLVVAYLLWLHSANSTFVTLPGFISLPPAIVIATALAFGWLAAWLPARLVLWRKDRDIRKLTKRVQELEQHVPSYDRIDYERMEDEADQPVIPDRTRNVPATSDTDLS